MKRQKEVDILLDLFFMLNAIRNGCLFFSLSKMATFVFYSIHVVLACIIVIIIILKISKPIKVSWQLLMPIVLSVMLLIVPLSYDDGAVWKANAFTPISVLLTMVFLVVSKDMRISARTIRFCYITYIFQAIVAAYCIFLPGAFEQDSLVLNIGNPNQTAIILWTSFVFCYLYWTKRRLLNKHTFVLSIVIVGLVIMIILTRARSILLAVLICLAWHFWGNKKRGYRIFSLAVQYVLILAPLYIPVIILFLTDILPRNVAIFGKLLFSGREPIWRAVANAFFQNPFSYHLDESPFYSNVILNNVETVKAWGAHNGLLSLQWNYGILVLLPVMYILYMNVKELRQYADNNIHSCVVYVVVLATIFSLSFEEALLTGNVCTATILPLLFVIGRSEQHNSSNSQRVVKRQLNNE